jgi:hypothetical protein
MSRNPQVRAAIAAARERQAGAVGLSIAQEQKLKRKLRRICPSEPWVEEQICSKLEIDSRGKPFVRRYHDPHLFPPGGSATRMVRCGRCRVWTPPQALDEGICLDHSEHIGWGRSPSAEMIEKIQFYCTKDKAEQLDLPSESVEALHAEIEQHYEKARRRNAKSACENK